MRFVISSSSDTPETLLRWLSIELSTACAVVCEFWIDCTSLPTPETNAAYAWSTAPPLSAAIACATSLAPGLPVVVVWIVAVVAATPIVPAVVPLKNGVAVWIALTDVMS